MAIMYKNQEIGFVRDIKFDDNKSKVNLFIYTEFKKYITNKSRFYKKGVVNLKASLSGVLFEVDNFSSLLNGSINLDTDSKVGFEKYQIFQNEDDMKNSTNSITIVFNDVEGLQENFFSINIQRCKCRKSYKS